jgi:hypothetical protein
MTHTQTIESLPRTTSDRPKAIGFVSNDVSGSDAPRHAIDVQRHAHTLGYQYVYTVRPPADVAEHGRATAVAACGTGKTLIGAECSVRLVPDGSVLIVVPTVELLSQTARSYAIHLGAAAGVIAAVCGDKQATDSAAELRVEITDLHAPVTTDPVEVADLTGRGKRVTVFATYASLPVITAAHAQNGLGRWGLVVVDEAHRTAGVKGQWAQIHEDRLVPAVRRLYLTATPRIMTIGGTKSVSMDDPTVFGRQVFHLPFAAASTDTPTSPTTTAVRTATRWAGGWGGADANTRPRHYAPTRSRSWKYLAWNGIRSRPDGKRASPRCTDSAPSTDTRTSPPTSGPRTDAGWVSG